MRTLNSIFRNTAKSATSTAAAAFLAGCATMAATPSTGCMESSGLNVGVLGTQKTTYNEQCARDNFAAQAIGSSDPELQALGIAIRKETDPQTARAIAQIQADFDAGRNPVTQLPAGYSVECALGEVVSNDPDGRRTFRNDGCRVVPAL